jgi:hypothetical protein
VRLSFPILRCERSYANLSIRFIGYLKDAGFYKQGEVAFSHKQSAVMKLDRESWEAPST